MSDKEKVIKIPTDESSAPIIPGEQKKIENLEEGTPSLEGVISLGRKPKAIGVERQHARKNVPGIGSPEYDNEILYGEWGPEDGPPNGSSQEAPRVKHYNVSD